MVVRVVAWNCRGGFHHKDDDLFKLDPDIAVVSEASKPSIDKLTDCSTVWMAIPWRGATTTAPGQPPSLKHTDRTSSSWTSACPKWMASKGCVS